MNLEKAKNLFGCRNEENRRLNNIELDIYISFVQMDIIIVQL